MSAQKLQSFFAQAKPLSYKKHEIILRSDSVPSGVFFIKKGYVKTYSISKEGEELTLIIFKPGDFFPIQWAFNDIVNNYNVEALTSLEMWRVPREQFLDFLKDNPDVMFELMCRILTRLGGLLDRMEQLVFGNAYQKIASILYIFAERFGEKKGAEIVIPLNLTHKDIAALVGLTRETVSVEMKRLEDKKLIGYINRHILVKNASKLREESSIA